MARPDDLTEWVSFSDEEEDRTWLFDVTFLTSSWTCIFGRGCQGVLEHDNTAAMAGCCSHGAHFSDEADIERTERRARELTPAQWQLRNIGIEQGIVVRDGDEATTRLVDGACVFLNRPGFDGDGLGCAFHHAAQAVGEGHLDWMPEVCWQVPLRRVDETDDNGHVTSTVREWKRRDWGEGGFEFHWWCTDSHEAFVGSRPVYLEMEAELRALVGDRPYELFRRHVERRTNKAGTKVYLRHPAQPKRGRAAS